MIDAHEIWLSPRASRDSGQRQLALDVIAHGLNGLSLGDAPWRTLVLPAEPTLDDLLAARFVEYLVAEEPIPRGAEDLARYAQLVREGLRPSSLPLEQSLEGLFLALRADAGPSLREGDASTRFTRRARDLVDHALSVVAAGSNPFQDPLFEEDPSFSREQAFLRDDLRVYQEDVRRGERWRIRFPADSMVGSALLLHQPRSLLAKYWYRDDSSAPEGGRYLVLVVSWDDHRWVISTDPVQRLSLKPLATLLQKAEDGCSSTSPAERQWFDGAPFSHSLIAAPASGTCLTRQQVLSVLRRWLRASSVTGHADVAASRSRVVRVVLPALLLLIALGGWLLWRRFHGTSAPVEEGHPSITRSSARNRAQRPALNAAARLRVAARDAKDTAHYALIVGSGPADLKGVHSGPLPYLESADRDAARFYGLLHKRYGYRKDRMILLVDDPQRAGALVDSHVPDVARSTLPELRRAVQRLAQRMEQPAGSRATPQSFVFFFEGHGVLSRRSHPSGYLVLDGCSTQLRSGPPGQDIDSRCLEMSSLLHLLHVQIHAAHQLFLINSCHSGHALKEISPETLQFPWQVFPEWERNARILITATTPAQLAYTGTHSSFFTTALLAALGPSLAADRTDRDGIVTSAELFVFLKRFVEDKARLTGRLQTPQYRRDLPDDDIGDFLFVPIRRP